MLRIRSLIFLAGCFLAASAAWANDTGYIDCSKYPENTQVLDKAGMTSGAVAFLPCGERFTILVHGEFFTQIQTKDGKVGYLHTYEITTDTSAAPKPQSAPAPTPAPAPTNPSTLSANAAGGKFKIISTTSSAPSPTMSAPSMTSSAPATTSASQPISSTRPPTVPAPTSASAQPPAPAQIAAPTANVAAIAPAVQPKPSALAPTAPAPAAKVSPAPASAAASTATASATTAAAQPDVIPPAQIEISSSTSVSTSGAVEQPKPSAPVAQSVPPASPSTTAAAPPTPTVAAEQPKSNPSVQVAAPPSGPPIIIADQPKPTTPIVQPEPPAPAPSQPVPIQPAVESPQIKVRRPGNPSPFPSTGGVSMFELFAGYGFTRFGYSGNGTNVNGALGSFGMNLTSRLQIIGDASYSLVNISGTTNPIYGTPVTNGSKNVVYGNHFGPRFYLRSRTARGPIPFVEGLVGGTRIDTTASGATTSKNGLTYKAGGGVDLTISRHLAVRLVDADFYRLSFLTTSRNNYVASVGIIIRFGNRPRF